MSDLKWATGEACRVGDEVLDRRWNVRRICTAVAESVVVVKNCEGVEFSAPPSDWDLLRRAGEAEDRDREKDVYDEELPGFYEGWEMIVKEPPLVFRRLRQPAPPAAPAKPPADETTEGDEG
jgi:hypothetical protein